MKELLLVGLLIGFLEGRGYYHHPYRAWDIKLHNINQVELSISNYGKIGQGVYGNPGCSWPKGSGISYMFGSGVWIGAIDSIIEDTLVTVGYGPHGAETECAPGLYGQAPGAPHVIIYMYPSPWPAPVEHFPMAPQVHKSHQDSWACYNDCDSIYHAPNDTRPIGIEVYQTVYAWDLPRITDIIFITIEVKNVLAKPIRDLYIGYVADCDLTITNDFSTAIIGRWYVINGESLWVDNLAYQWENTGSHGVIGFDLLQTPFDLQWGCDKDHDSIPDQYERDSSYYWNNLPAYKWDVDNDFLPDWRDASENPQSGMTAFKKFTLFLEPNKDNERYLSLAGYNFRTGQYEPYDTVITQPGDDYRLLMASGPFQLMPDSTVTFIFAILFANWHNIYQTPDTAIVLVDKWAQAFYDLNWHLGIREFSQISMPGLNLKVHPQIIHNFADVCFNLKESDALSLNLYNLNGQKIKSIFEGNRSAGHHQLRLYTKGLPAGVYFLVLETSKEKQEKKVIIIK